MRLRAIESPDSQNALTELVSRQLVLLKRPCFRNTADDEGVCHKGRFSDEPSYAIDDDGRPRGLRTATAPVQSDTVPKDRDLSRDQATFVSKGPSLRDTQTTAASRDCHPACQAASKRTADRDDDVTDERARMIGKDDEV